MKVCITSKGATLDSRAEERFGRAPFFIIIETETGTFEAIQNSLVDGEGGVGPKAAQVLVSLGVRALISGMVGGNAREVLAAAGIEVYAYRDKGTVKDAFDKFTANTLVRSG